MKGVIEDFDKYMIGLVSQGKQHLIYKHASALSLWIQNLPDSEATGEGEE